MLLPYGLLQTTGKGRVKEISMWKCNAKNHAQEGKPSTAFTFSATLGTPRNEKTWLWMLGTSWRNFSNAVIRLKWDGFQKEIYVEKKCRRKLAASDIAVCGLIVKVRYALVLVLTFSSASTPEREALHDMNFAHTDAYRNEYNKTAAKIIKSRLSCFYIFLFLSFDTNV